MTTHPANKTKTLKQSKHCQKTVGKKVIYKVNHSALVLKEMARDHKSKSRQHSKQSRRVKVGGAKNKAERSAEGKSTTK